MLKVPRLALVLFAVVVCPLSAQRGGRGAGGAVPVGPPRFTYLGPENGGRIAAVAGVPGDTSTYYFGAATGGIWKTTDGAHTFAPVFDAQPVQSIGALATAPSNPRIVWAGTGEAWAIRDADVMGDGVYKSTDAGTTWQHMGLAETGRIGKIVIHPTNPNIVYVCALGRATGPQQERGVYRTLDAGNTWTRVLFVDENTGCSGLSIDPENPGTLFAGTWEVVMHTWAMFSGGNGSGVYVSHDSGSTWKRIVDPGLPHSPLGKIDVAVAPSNSSRVYALIQTANQGSLWRSDDGGGKWRVVSWDRSLIGRAGYYIRMEVNPENDLEVLIANSTFHRSVNGGETFPIADRGCGDCHDIWVDPRNSSHWVETGDGGAGITRDHGQHFTQFSLPIGQMYHVAIDDRIPYWVYGNRQDDGTMRGPSNSPVQVADVPSYAGGGGRGGGAGGGRGARTGGAAAPAAADSSARPGGRGAAPAADTVASAGPAAPDFGAFGGRGGRGGGVPWQAGLGGCESGFTLPTPGNPDIIWASCYGNTVTRFDNKVGLARSVSPWMHTLDMEPNKAKYRCHWTPPLAIDPFDPATVYYGCQVIFKTSNAGQSWKVISPDLSTNDSTHVVSSGGIIGDNLGQFYGEVVFAIAPSEIQKGLIWAGTNDGKVWNTVDGGRKWNDVTRNVTGMPPWGTVRKIEPSRFDPRTAYMVVDYHMMDDRKPYIYKTADLGRTWTRISDGLPQDHPLSYALSIAENPNRKGMLFAGTGHAIYYTLDDGGSWAQLRGGLPAAPVTWIVVAKRDHDVVVSTYGRAIYVMRDITQLESADRVAAGVQVHLYEPLPGLRNARSGSAAMVYLLATAPRDSLKVEFVDSAGITVRTMKFVGRAGTSRATWDLRYDPPREPALRTTPPDNPHIWDEARYKNKMTRQIVHWGIEEPQRVGPLAAAGNYTFRLTVDGQVYSEPFTVTKDPEIPSSVADLQTSTRTQARIRDDIDTTAGIINAIEIVRKQIEDDRKSDSASADLEQSLQALDQKALEVEMRLLTRSDLHSDDKWYVEQPKVYLDLIWLYGEVGTGAGDVAGGADYRPTDASMGVLSEIESDLSGAKSAFAEFLARDLPAFNASMAGKLPPITDKLPEKKPALIP
ncbi:MAG: WD40/YVTN/BNR-like repeat-containing protein [Gemmatimonadales bacterium]